MHEDITRMDDRKKLSGTGLCLSGGGYRAALFHVGALRRLNEVGRLRDLRLVASVSGGSIVAALVGLRWADLGFDDRGCAERFTELVEDPVLALAGRTVDVPAVLTGLLWPSRISRRVARAYDRHLFHGATLQDLPGPGQGPEFRVLATNLSNGTLWRFSRADMGDWRDRRVQRPTLRLADAVAASSAFPPVLSPSLLRLPDRTVHLTDGGVYDNLGTEPVLKKCAEVFVSDGGGMFKEPQAPATDWVRGTLRLLRVIDVQVRRLRRSRVVGLLKSGRRSGAFWAINSDHTSFDGRSPALPCPVEATRHLAAVPTRLRRLDEPTCYRLVNWGYAVADAVLRSYFDPSLPQPTGFPYPAAGVGGASDQPAAAV
jgi:NTE family protein